MSLSSSAPHAPSVVITALVPSVDGGRHPVKRIAGDVLRVEADIFKDGHDVVAAALLWRPVGEEIWHEQAMEKGDNDRWSAAVEVPRVGRYEYTVAAWPDLLVTWVRDFRKKVDARVSPLDLELQEGALLVKGAALRARLAGSEAMARDLVQLGELLGGLSPNEAIELMESPDVKTVLAPWPDRGLLTLHEPVRHLIVEPEIARFSAWYEFFPRNAHCDGHTHATLRQCRPMLEHAAGLGFDVIYLPPVHPIGITNRKGKNNSTTCQPGEIGSPWAIGGPAGGHTAIEPALGTLADFDFFLSEARSLGLEVAMDFALQCSPDHPWVREHPEWFHVRPDGSIQYAENPPKKYQDIYPLHFHNPDWRAMWSTLKDALLFWCARGVRIFRVDNPHTKPVAFWEYAIAETRAVYPETIFLSEAFTTPKMMAELAKIGFSQSYTYFTWRTNKHELAAYVEELTSQPVVEFMRGNFWPNTPDILAYELWNAPPAKFRIRATLAALLMPSWGMYSGYEFCENKPLPPKEEYLDSEKYQLVARNLRAQGITADIAALNLIRRENPACRLYDNIRFVPAANDHILAWTRVTPDQRNRLLVVVNMDAGNTQATTLELPLHLLGLGADRPFAVRDLLTGERWTWQGARNYVELNPQIRVAHVFLIES
ncbi:MAG: alpha-1,4-glucan--maltose-1-phosphate maltosyltransferase [Verrucomicrobiales bacterium]